MITVLIADDHTIVREGLKAFLEMKKNIKVVGSAADGVEAVRLVRELKPDVVIMDIAMPELNGIEATHKICRHSSSPKVIILSMFYTVEHVFRAFQAGALGYLLKESAGSEIVKALSHVKAGRRYLSEKIVETTIFDCLSPRKRSPLELLSRREMEILQMVVEGKSSADIAGKLSLSSKSVDTYRSRLKNKLGVSSLQELIRFAIQHGLTPLS